MSTENRTRTFTVYRKVAEVHNETRTVCVNVPVVEEKTIMQTHVSCKPVVKTVCRSVDRGHYECREVCCPPKSHCLKDLMAKFCCRHKDCCEPCCEPCCTKTVKVWCPCWVQEECQVTTWERVCESHPVTIKVQSCRQETRQETYPVTTWKCVPEQRTETYQVCVPHQVPYTATRTVKVCVPYTETVTCCAAPSCCQPKCCHKCCGHLWKSHSCCD
jgi:hypothetical protein